MTQLPRTLLNGAIATLVATSVAYAVDRNRPALATGLLSGTMTALSSYLAARQKSGATQPV